MADVVLELQNVSRIFGEGDTQVKALDNVSLSIRRGEFVLIVGSSEDIRQNATDLLIKVGLEDQINKRSNKISGGQAQRAAIARGLVNRPTIVLADEPTGNLDSVTAGKIVKLAKTMAKELNQTFIIVTHDRHQFPDVDRVITIKDGKAFSGEETTMEITA